MGSSLGFPRTGTLASGATTALLLPPKKGDTLRGRWVLSARDLLVLLEPLATTIGDRREDERALQPFLLILKLELRT